MEICIREDTSNTVIAFLEPPAIAPVDGEVFSFWLSIPDFNSSSTGGFYYVMAKEEGSNKTAYLAAVSHVYTVPRVYYIEGYRPWAKDNEGRQTS